MSRCPKEKPRNPFGNDGRWISYFLSSLAYSVSSAHSKVLLLQITARKSVNFFVLFLVPIGRRINRYTYVILVKARAVPPAGGAKTAETGSCCFMNLTQSLHRFVQLVPFPPHHLVGLDARHLYSPSPCLLFPHDRGCYLLLPQCLRPLPPMLLYDDNPDLVDMLVLITLPLVPHN